jgi:hypothetical protein
VIVCDDGMHISIAKNMPASTALIQPHRLRTAHVLKPVICSLDITQVYTVGEPSFARGLDSVWYAQTKEIARLVLSERGEEDVTQT